MSPPSSGTGLGPTRAARQLDLSARLRGFGAPGLLAILFVLAGTLVTPLLGAIGVLLWTWTSKTPWSHIGYVRPRSLAVEIAGGVLFGGLFKLLMKAMVMPLLGAPAMNPAFHYLAGNRSAIPGALFLFIVGAGFGEETVFRGYFFERLGKLLGESAAAKAAIVGITSTLFALAHYSNQGLPGTEQAMITGIAFGTIFAVTGRIWIVMCAHAAFDLTAYALIYWNLEASVAHFVFR